ncbi:MAG: hypothetical protein LBU98_00250 [Alistipes sp.]|nr:hypothetical protein [Alistipes sp.]
MKRTLTSMLGASLLLFGLGACSQETPAGGVDPVRGKGSLTIEVEGLSRGAGAAATRGPQTRADYVPSVNGENTVNSLYLLFFDPATGLFDSYERVAGIPGTPTQENMSGNVPMNIDGVPYPAGRSADAWDILAIANIDESYFVDNDPQTAADAVGDWMAQWTGRDMEYVTSNALATLPPAIASERLLMHGTIEKPAGETQIHLMLTRDVARIDVTMASTHYRIMSATIWNAFPTSSVWDGGSIDLTSPRVERHYGVTLTEGGTPQAPTWPGSIRGGLYAFENRVSALADGAYNDHFTTCLVVGIQEIDADGDPVTGKTLYYRANIVNANNAQTLTRNHVYNLVIQDADRELGKDSEQEAYLGESNGLSYFIGDWSEDLNGLVVSDGISTISIPTKMVAMGRDASTAELRIHTFSTLADPAPLRIRSQSYTPATNTAGDPSITATLDGNTLQINSTDLDADGTPRSGVIVLSYAGLEIAMNVSQSGTNDYFLTVTEPDGGILPFAAYAGIPSGLINVQASGNWTARLYMAGFSFDNQQAADPDKWIWTNPANPGDEGYPAGGYTDGRPSYNNTLRLLTPDENDSTVKKFRVWTHSHNDTNGPRNAFVVVSLDGVNKYTGEPLADTYTSIIQLTQNYVRALHYTPSHKDPTVEADRQSSGGVTTFNGAGALATGASMINNSDWWFVNPGYQTDGVPTSGILPWNALLVSTGGADDRDFFEIVRTDTDTTTPDDPTLPGYNETTHRVTRYNATDETKNYVRVRAKGINVSGREYRVTLRVQTDPGTFADITVVQQPLPLKLSPAVITDQIPIAGGMSEPIAVDTDPSMKWKFTLQTNSSTSTAETGSRRLVHHEATLVDEAGNPLVEGQEYPVSTKFRVKFPRLYLTNHGISAQALVTVNVGPQSQTISVNQAVLSWRYVYAHFNYTGIGYGSLNMAGYNYTAGLKPLIVLLNRSTEPTYNGGPFIGNTHFLHRTNELNYEWTNTNDYVENGDGVFWLVADYAARTGNMSGFASEFGWSFSSAGGNHWWNAGSETKVYEFIRNYTATNLTTLGVYDGESTKATSIPSSATGIIGADGGGYYVVIDPKTRVVYVGESQTLGQLENGALRRVWPYAALTAKYGRSFSDMLVEDADGGVPAPWDAYWDDRANGGTDNRITDFFTGGI